MTELYAFNGDLEKLRDLLDKYRWLKDMYDFKFKTPRIWPIIPSFEIGISTLDVDLGPVGTSLGLLSGLIERVLRAVLPDVHLPILGLDLDEFLFAMNAYIILIDLKAQKLGEILAYPFTKIEELLAELGEMPVDFVPCDVEDPRERRALPGGDETLALLPEMTLELQTIYEILGIKRNGDKLEKGTVDTAKRNKNKRAREDATGDPKVFHGVGTVVIELSDEFQTDWDEDDFLERGSKMDQLPNINKVPKAVVPVGSFVDREEVDEPCFMKFEVREEGKRVTEVLEGYQDLRGFPRIEEPLGVLVCDLPLESSGLPKKRKRGLLNGGKPVFLDNGVP